MMFRILLLWVVGGLIIIPYALYHLFSYARPDEYAFLMVMPFFWIFGFWGVVGPAIAVYRIHKLMKALEHVRDRKGLQEAYEAHAGKEVMVDFIASEHRLPKFLVRRLYDTIERRLRAPAEP